MENTKFYQLLASFNFNGVSFVGLRGYTSNKSDNTEVADIRINVGVTYAKAKETDLTTLTGAKKVAASLATAEFNEALILQAIDEKIKSIVAPNENRSNGQKEAYIILTANGSLKYCPETDNLLIWGKVISKNVLVKGEYKKVTSKPITLAKRYLDKVLDLDMAKFRQYIVTNTTSLKIRGEEFEID